MLSRVSASSLGALSRADRPSCFKSLDTERMGLFSKGSYGFLNYLENGLEDLLGPLVSDKAGLIQQLRGGRDFFSAYSLCQSSAASLEDFWAVCNRKHYQTLSPKETQYGLGFKDQGKDVGCFWFPHVDIDGGPAGVFIEGVLADTPKTPLALVDATLSELNSATVSGKGKQNTQVQAYAQGRDKVYLPCPEGGYYVVSREQLSSFFDDNLLIRGEEKENIPIQYTIEEDCLLAVSRPGSYPECLDLPDSVRYSSNPHIHLAMPRDKGDDSIVPDRKEFKLNKQDIRLVFPQTSGKKPLSLDTVVQMLIKQALHGMGKSGPIYESVGAQDPRDRVRGAIWNTRVTPTASLAFYTSCFLAKDKAVQEARELKDLGRTLDALTVHSGDGTAFRTCLGSLLEYDAITSNIPMGFQREVDFVWPVDGDDVTVHIGYSISKEGMVSMNIMGQDTIVEEFKECLVPVIGEFNDFINTKKEKLAAQGTSLFILANS